MRGWFSPDYLDDSASQAEVERHDTQRILTMMGIFLTIPFMLLGIVLVVTWLTIGVCT